MTRRSVMMLCALLPAACADASGPDTVPTEELQFVRFAEGAFPLAQRSGSVWAVKGEHRELVLRYMPDEPGEEGEEFLELDIPGDGLLRSPEGRLYQEGDSVLITVQVDDAGRFLFTFAPSGLTFDPDHQPELEITYRRADDDFDDDGDHDDDDDRVESRLRIWKREQPTDPWRSIGTVRIGDDEVEARLRSFTGFALAS
jgi:hypothetical protein